MSDMEFPQEMDRLLTPIDGGYHVKDRDDGKACIDIVRMLFNWRIVRTLKVEGYPDHVLVDGGWCFYGTGVDAEGRERSMASAEMRAAMIALVWDGYGDPPMFDKRAHAVREEESEVRLSAWQSLRASFRPIRRR